MSLRRRKYVAESSDHAVTHDTFSKDMDDVMSGDARMIVVTYTRQWPIDKKTVLKFRSSGHEVIKPSNDGIGFRMQSGPKSVYVMPGSLILQKS